MEPFKVTFIISVFFPQLLGRNKKFLPPHNPVAGLLPGSWDLKTKRVEKPKNSVRNLPEDNRGTAGFFCRFQKISWNYSDVVF